MQPIGLREEQTTLTDAFVEGLQRRYGPELASLYREVIDYRLHVTLAGDELRHCVELDTAPALQDIVANKVSGATFRAFRALLIGGALQDDRKAVVRWATEGLNRCQQGDGEWPATRAEWQTVLADPDSFIHMARQIKYFLNQL